MKIRPVSTQPVPVLESAWRYGVLLCILALLVSHIRWYLSLPAYYEGDPYAIGVVILLLLFNHLAYGFQWRPWIATALSVVSIGWNLFTCFYMLYWSQVLYPGG